MTGRNEEVSGRRGERLRTPPEDEPESQGWGKTEGVDEVLFESNVKCLLL